MAIEKLIKSDAEWKKILTPEQYFILREGGTETSGSCVFTQHKEGIYSCIACGNPLFVSDAKFESHTGWPSFFTPYSEEAIILRPDTSGGMNRVEVICAKCEGHLGHVFDDGPPPTHKRFCINGLVLKFMPKK